MKKFLLIETSTRICSAALVTEEKVLAERVSAEGNDHASMLTPFIRQITEESGTRYSDLAAVAVSNGPGSYTGLRIGLSTAKGICYAAGLPLITISTLESIAWQFSEQHAPDEADLLVCPMIDARRQEVYTCLYNLKMEQVMPPGAHILSVESFAGELADNRIVFCGDGAAKAKSYLQANSNAVFPLLSPLVASSLRRPAILKYKAKAFADLAYSEPFYLKEFQAGIPKVKGLKPSA